MRRESRNWKKSKTSSREVARFALYWVSDDRTTASWGDHTAHFVRADLYRQGCSFFAARQRTNQENAPKGLIPFGNPQRVFVGAALSLRATRREDVIFQRLYVRVKETRTHFRAKIFRGEEGEGAPLLAVAILQNNARPSPYRVRRSSTGERFYYFY